MFAESNRIKKLGGRRLPLRQEEAGSRGQPGLQIDMGAGRLGQGIGLIDGDSDLTALQNVEEVIRGGDEILPARGVVVERGACREQRAFLRQEIDPELRHRTGGLPEADP